MSRTNTVSWVDGRVLTKLMGNLQRELMEWQMHAYPVVTERSSTGPIGGDRSVLVAAIELRNALVKVCDKSALVNAPKTEEIS